MQGRDRLLAFDPGLSQLRRSGRATLAAAVAAWILFHLIQWFHEPPTIAFVGIQVAMLGSMLVTDPHPSQQRITMLWVPLVAVVSVFLGALAGSILWLNNLIFLIIIFLAVYSRRWGQRFSNLGMIGFLAYFVTLFFHARPADVPWMAGGVAIGAGIAYALRFWILPDRPEQVLRHTLNAYRAQLRIVLHHLDRVLRHNSWSAGSQKRFGHLVAKLNEQALLLEDQINTSAEVSSWPEHDRHSLRLQILELELSVEGMTEALQHLIVVQALDEREKNLLREALAAARLALENDLPLPSSEALQAQLVGLGQLGSSRSKNAALQRFADSFSDLVFNARGLARRKKPLQSPTASKEPTCAPEAESSSMPASISAPAPSSAVPALRQAVQATIAGALAMAAGEVISPTRWYWAVIAAFVVFIGTATGPETLVRAWHRILGTVIGVGLGLALAELVHGHRRVELVLVFVCIFFAYLLIRISYVWMIIWFTILLSVLYSLLGRLTPELLSLRLLLTVVGAAVGTLSALLILPLPTRDRVNATMGEVLLAASAFLRAVLDTAKTGQTGWVSLAREMDRKLQQLRTASAPLYHRFLPISGRDKICQVHATLALALFARHFAHGWSELGPEADFLPWREVGLRLASRSENLAKALQQEKTPDPMRGSQWWDVLPAEPRLRQDPALHGPVHWLQRIHQELATLSQSCQP